MRIEILPDADAVASRAARFIGAEARAAVAARGLFTLAVSGGRTPWQMLRALSSEQVPWQAVHLFQVDERIAPAGDSDRNLTHIDETLLKQIEMPRENMHEMPVEETDLVSAAARYAEALRAIAGSPATLDLVHLGLGADGHTASLVPGDAVLDVSEADVAVTGVYQHRPRMTLTFPVLNRALCVLWVVTGADKASMLARMIDGDRSIPAGRMRQDRAVLFTDQAAAPAAT
jgi:6-phosphogluconolactonase